MSLINQMLRDLDARRGPASSVEIAALQGMGLANGKPHAPHLILQLLQVGTATPLRSQL
jgi:hypothetical protein